MSYCKEKTKIAVFGAGYVGLSIATMLATKYCVNLFDISLEKIELIKNKKSPIKDAYISDYFEHQSLNLNACSSVEEALHDVNLAFIATPTDYDTEKKYFNVDSVLSVIKLITSINPNIEIVVKSTLPVGFTENTSKDFKITNLHFSPEFLREGKALYDNLYPSRIIIGTNNKEFGEYYIEIMKSVALKDNNDIPSLIIHPTEAESVKLFANTYLAMRVAFFNELDNYTIVNGLSTQNIIEGMCLDPRIGDYYNNPSFGYGGYCLPKDTKQLLANFEHVPNSLIKAIVDSNDIRVNFIADEIISKKPKTVGVFRLIMKSGSDNFRASAIQKVIKVLTDKNVNIVIYEPILSTDKFNGYSVISDLKEFKDISDVIISNRFDSTLDDVKEKVFTRDIFNNN